MTATERSLQLAKVAAVAAEEKIAAKVMAIDVSDQMPLTDVFVIASGANDRQVGAIVDAVEEKLRAEGYKPARREGQREGRWVLIDFGDIIVHVQHEEEREYYALERLWKDCPEVDLGAVDLLPRPVAKGQAEPGGPDEDSVDPVDSGVDEA